jgi:phosphinothricin acetyltransferase
MNIQNQAIQDPEIQFRNAELSDLESIVAIYNSTIASRMVTADTEPVTTESRKRWFAEHHPDSRPLWIVQNAEKAITGWVSLQDFYGRPAYAKTAEISIYLDEYYRGRGLGARVLADSIRRASGLGIETLMGFIFAHNIPSLQLFRKAGFEEWGHMPDVAELEGIKRSVKILGKKIGPQEMPG